MSSEYREPLSDPDDQNRRPMSELWGEWGPLGQSSQSGQPGQSGENNAPRPTIPASSNDNPNYSSNPTYISNSSSAEVRNAQPFQQPHQNNSHADFTHREHVTGSLAAYPSDAPLFRPGYQPSASARPPVPPVPAPYYSPQQAQQWQRPPYPSQQPQQGYPPYAGYPPRPGYAYNPAYYGYPPYPAAWYPQKPKRNTYLFVMNILATVGAGLAMAVGLICAFFVLALAVTPHINVTESSYFSSQLTLIAFMSAGLVGGSFCLYHCIRSFMKRSSAKFMLPVLWIFVVLYIGVIVAGFGLHVNGLEVVYPVLTIFLIALAALFPALALLSLGVRRLRFPTISTTWRRFTVALTSGATLGVSVAGLLEIISLLVVAAGTRSLFSVQQCISDPNAPSSCQSFSSFVTIFLTVAIIGPFVEELVKPIAVIAMIGRIESAAEAFILGMACGIGFDLIETVGYIGSGYHNWLNVALERTGAGLLHGFGAAMASLGWYYIFRKRDTPLHVIKGLGFIGYAIFQHFVWNTTATLSLFPDPIGSTINSWYLNFGFFQLPFVEILNILEAILILVFFVYMTGRLREKRMPPPTLEQRRVPSVPESQVYARP